MKYQKSNLLTSGNWDRASKQIGKDFFAENHALRGVPILKTFQVLFRFAKRHISRILKPETRDALVALKRYSFFGKIHPKEELLILKIDGSFFHGGFCDRLKGAISLFHFTSIKGIKFKLLYTYPFPLTDFLIPNKYDWEIKKEMASRNIFEVKYVNLVADATPRRLAALTTKKQIQCYANRDIVDELNRLYSTSYQWNDLFNILFKPTKELSELIDYHKSKIACEYVCAVYRFQQLLGDFKEYEFPELEDSEKEQLIRKNLSAIDNLLVTHPGKKVLVTSDSLTFLNRASEISGVYIIPGKVVHIDNTSGEQHEVYLKSFLDFFLLSEGKKIYSIGTDKMYKSDFPVYAAKIKNIPFERILLN